MKKPALRPVFCLAMNTDQAKLASAKSQLTSEVRKVSTHFGRMLR